MDGLFTLALSPDALGSKEIAKVILDDPKKAGKLIASRSVFDILREHSFWKVLPVPLKDTELLSQTLMFAKRECDRFNCTRIRIIICAKHSLEVSSIVRELCMEVVEVVEVCA